MSLQNGFQAILKTLLADCHYYRQSFNRQKRRNTIEGSFGYDIVDKAYKCFRTLLKPKHRTIKTTYKRLRSCFESLNALAVELDRFYKDYWAKYVRGIVEKLGQLLPDDFIQLSLFDVSLYTDNRITEKPTFRCFKVWLNGVKDRLFKQDLGRYLNNPNFSFEGDGNLASEKGRVWQLGIRGLVV